MRTDHVPNGVNVLDVVRILIGLKCAIPDTGFPFAPAADFAFVGFIDHQFCTFGFGFFIADVFAVIGNAGGTIVIWYSRQCAAGDFAQRLNQAGDDVFKVRNVVFVQFRRQFQTMITGIVKHTGKMGEVKLTRLTGFDTCDIFIRTAKGARDNVDAGFFGIGREGIFFKRLGHNAAPTVKADLFRCGCMCLAGQHAHRATRDTGNNTGSTKGSQESTAADVTVAIAIKQAFVTFGIVHLRPPDKELSVNRLCSWSLLLYWSCCWFWRFPAISKVRIRQFVQSCYWQGYLFCYSRGFCALKERVIPMRPPAAAQW